MSGLEKEELSGRIKAMSEDEKRLVLKMLPTDMIWEEAERRNRSNRMMISSIRQAVRASRG